MKPKKREPLPMAFPYDGKPIRGTEQSYGTWTKAQNGVHVRCAECGDPKQISKLALKQWFIEVDGEMVSKRPFRCVCGFARKVVLSDWDKSRGE